MCNALDPHNSDVATSLTNKTAVVTGGTTGIGRAIALCLAGNGARVLICGRHEAELKEALADLQQAGDAHGVIADISKQEDVEKLIAEADRIFGHLDILVNNAGVGGEDLLDSSPHDLRYTVETNLTAYLACARAAARRMIPRKSGHIVNIGSIVAEKLKAGGEIYTATKSAVRGFSKAFAKTVREHHIRVTLIEPGLVGSDMIEVPPEEQPEKIAQEQMLKAEDIAEAVRFCLVQPPRCAIGMIQIGPLLPVD